MPTDRDYAIATMLGENRGDTNQGLAAILDLIMNRKADPGAYQAKSASIKDIVTAANGNQFNNWKPSDPNSDISRRALQGIGSMSASEARLYAQAAQVYDDYMAGKNGYQGIAQGATFYQTPKSAENQNSFQNKYYGPNGDNLITVGKHQFTGQNGLFYKDQNAFYQKFPQYNPMASAGYDPSSPLNPGIPTQGPGDYFGSGTPPGATLGGATPTAGPTQTVPLPPGRPSDIDLNGLPRPNDYGAIASLYQQDLGRSPDADGANYWLKQLANGQSLMQIDQGIKGSDESKAYRNLPSTNAGTYDPTTGAGAMQPSDILNTAYNAVLHRAPDAAGSDYFSQQLQNGNSLAGIMDALMQSPEYAQTIGAPNPTPTLGPDLTPTQGPTGTTPTEDPRLSQYSSTVNDAFNTILHRAPDATGLDYFDGQLQAGTLDPTSLQAAIKASPEYLSMHPEEVQTQGPKLSEYRSTINDAFNAILHRAPDASGMDYFSQELQNGTPQSILEAQLLASPEAQTLGAPELSQLVNNYKTQYGLSPEEVQTLAPAASQFASVLGRPVDTPTLQYWDSQIDGGASMPSILAQMLQAPEVQAQQGSQGYQTAVDAFGKQFGINPADYLQQMLVGSGGVTGIGNAPGANQVGGTPSFNGMVFDPNAYLAVNPDVANSSWASNPLQHFEQFGYNEGRSLGNGIGPLSNGFNAQAYLAANPDVAMAGLDPLAHFLVNGAAEGRQATFSPDVGPYAFGKFSQTGLPPAGPTGVAGPINDGRPLGSGITYNNGSTQYGGVDIGAGALFDPASSEKSYLNTQVDQINQGAQHAANVANMLTGTNPATGYVPMPTFQVNGTNQGNSNAVGNAQGQYLNNVNTALGMMAPAAPAPSSFLPTQPIFTPWR